MHRFLSCIFYLLLGLILTACATQSKPSLPLLSDVLTDERVVKFPLKQTPFGRLIVDLQIADDKTAVMLLDTGATQSAFLGHAAKRFGLIADQEEVVRIHGLASNAEASLTTIERVSFGQDDYTQKDFALLPLRDDLSSLEHGLDGVIGMDILQNYRMYLNPLSGYMYFLPASVPDVTLPEGYKSVPLHRNLYNEAAPELRFISIYIRQRTIPALLDTGADVNFMNWHAADFAETKTIRAILKNKWKIAGAVGEFKPTARAKIGRIETDNYEWDDLIVVIEDSDSLEILGVKDKPFIVAGIDFLKGRDVYLDFANDTLWLGPPLDALPDIDAVKPEGT